MDMSFFERFKTKKVEEKMYGPEPESPEHKEERLKNVLEDMAITYSEMAVITGKEEMSINEKQDYESFKKKTDEFESDEYTQRELEEYMKAYSGEDDSLRWQVEYMSDMLKGIKAKKTQTP